MGEKSFVTVYDKGLEEFAEVIMTLVSTDTVICNIKRATEEFKKDKSIVSGEYVLYIGERGSAFIRQNFKDAYCNYGIHIGFYGTKAWISCERFEWGFVNEADFTIELHSTLERLGMNAKDYEKYVKACLLYKQLNDAPIASEKRAGEHRETTGLSPKDNPESIAERKAYLKKYLSFVVEHASELDWISDLSGSNKLKLQYRFAIALFYDKYLHDFLQIKKEEKENQQF